jgi:hypothetical protein
MSKRKQDQVDFEPILFEAKRVREEGPEFGPEPKPKRLPKFGPKKQRKPVAIKSHVAQLKKELKFKLKESLKTLKETKNFIIVLKKDIRKLGRTRKVNKKPKL